MPGTYEHEIIVNIDTKGLNISVDSDIAELSEAIREDLNDIREILDAGKKVILTSGAEKSQSLQRDSIRDYKSFVTGDLANSIDISTGSNASKIGTELFYAQYVEDGRGPVHVKNAKALHFITKDGDEVFAKSVGPAMPRPYLTDSSKKLEEYLETLLNEVLGEL